MFTNKNPFPDTLWKSLKAKLEPALKISGPKYAVFDADGTLWPLDAGETFFKYQLAHSNLKGLPADPWMHYWEMKDYDAPGSCLWLAQINKGVTLERVRKWADACFADAAQFPIHQSMYDLVIWLRQLGVEVYIVTASIKWAVEPLARRLGLKNENVIGIEVMAENGVLTDKGVYPLSYGEGKPVAFLNFSKSVRPILGAGNTLSDSHLVACASHVHLAISSAAPGEHSHDTELKLRESVVKLGGISHSFYKES